MRTEPVIAAIVAGVARKFARLLAGAFLLVATPCGAGNRTERINLSPKLWVGQTITYQIFYRADKDVKTQSNVTTLLSPGEEQIDVRGVLRMEIVDVHSEGGKAAIHARARFETPNPDGDLKAPEAESQLGNLRRIDPKSKVMEFTIAADGQVTDLQGLDALLPDEQQAWGEWVSLFAMAAAFPKKGVKRGEKWWFDETERSPAPLAGLIWIKRSTYVHDEPCGTALSAIEDAIDAGNQPSETCAVILTTATLKQKSSRRNAAPEDFKLHELQTSGTAWGTNQVIAYISLTTGLIVRATEEASQSMDVVVAKADGSNRVHYNVDAKSNAEVLLVTDRP